MAFSGAERQKRYRTKRNADSDRRAQWLAYQKEKYKTDKGQGKRKLAKGLAKQARRQAKGWWKKYQRDGRKQQADVNTIHTSSNSFADTHDKMATPDHLVVSKGNTDLWVDVVNESEPQWIKVSLDQPQGTQDQCSDVLSLSNTSTAITPCESSAVSPSAAGMKPAPDSQPASVQEIKVEPVDDYETRCGNSSSVVDFEVNFDCQTESVRANIINDVIKTELVTADINNDVIKTEPITANFSSDVVKTEWIANFSSDVIRTEPVTANFSSDVIKTEPVTTDISSGVRTNALTTNIMSDIKTEAVTDFMITVPCDAVRPESISSREVNRDRPASDMQDITNVPHKRKYTKDSKEAVRRRNAARTERKPEGKIQFCGTQEEITGIYSQAEKIKTFLGSGKPNMVKNKYFLDCVFGFYIDKVIDVVDGTGDCS